MFYNFQHYCSGSVVFGENTIQGIPEMLEQRFGIDKNILILTDENLVKIGLVENLVKILQKSNLKFNVYDRVLPEPTTEVVNLAAKFARDNKSDIVIGFGGGSVLDVGKVTAMLLKNDGIVENYVGINKVKNNIAPMIAVPTTAGTGSEVTMSSVITIPEEEKKSGVQSPLLIPTTAIIDPTLTYKIPQTITAHTGIDAFSHALESFVARRSTYLSDIFAIESFKMFYQSIREVVANGENLLARNNISLSSHLAGVALANAGGGIVHSTAHVLGAKYHIAHGLAIASTIYPCSKFNCIANPVKYAKLAKLLGKNIKNLDKMSAAKLGVEAIGEILRDLDLDLKAKEYGAKQEDIDILAEKVIADKRLTANNVRSINIEEVKKLFQEIIG